MEREFNVRPEFQDPARFPCGALGCQHRAAGWALPLHLPPGLQVRAETERVYLCEAHLGEALPGWSRR